MKKRDEAKELERLRREVETLTRRVSRLRRENARLQGVAEPKEDESDREKSVKPLRPQCPKCGSTKLGNFTTPSGKKVTGCKACKDLRK